MVLWCGMLLGFYYMRDDVEEREGSGRESASATERLRRTDHVHQITTTMAIRARTDGRTCLISQ